MTLPFVFNFNSDMYASKPLMRKEARVREYKTEINGYTNIYQSLCSLFRCEMFVNITKWNESLDKIRT